MGLIFSFVPWFWTVSHYHSRQLGEISIISNKLPWVRILKISAISSLQKVLLPELIGWSGVTWLLSFRINSSWVLIYTWWHGLLKLRIVVVRLPWAIILDLKFIPKKVRVCKLSLFQSWWISWFQFCKRGFWWNLLCFQNWLRDTFLGVWIKLPYVLGHVGGNLLNISLSFRLGGHFGATSSLTSGLNNIVTIWTCNISLIVDTISSGHYLLSSS